MSKIICIGEALIDFIPIQEGKSIMNVAAFEKRAGGAPANVACQCAKLGSKSAFLGAFGQDGFADFLKAALIKYNVELFDYKTEQAKTSLAFVTLSENGERDFAFFRNPGADMMLSPDFIREDMFGKNDILHFCSVCLCECDTEKAHRKAIKIIKEKGGLVSFDVNVRLPLWKSEDALKKAILEYLPYADIVKLSEEELIFVTGKNDEAAAIQQIKNIAPKIKLLFITRGDKGSTCITENKTVNVEAKKVKAIDTTGAGDSYIGCVLNKIDKLGLNRATENIESVMEFASVGAMLTVSKKGAIEAMPTLAKIRKQ